MTIDTSGHLYRKTTMKDMSGNIINLMDEATGGYIIRNRQVVDQERYDEIMAKQKDKEVAAQAALHPVDSPNAEIRKQPGGSVSIEDLNKPTQTVVEPNQPDRVGSLEQKVEGMEGKLDAILKALEK